MRNNLVLFVNFHSASFDLLYGCRCMLVRPRLTWLYVISNLYFNDSWIIHVDYIAEITAHGANPTLNTQGV